MKPGHPARSLVSVLFIRTDRKQMQKLLLESRLRPLWDSGTLVHVFTVYNWILGSHFRFRPVS